MNTILITSNAGIRIRPIQSWLFAKYMPKVKIDWIDLTYKPLNRWCANVADGIKALNPSEYVLFLLDDHLILDSYKLPISISNSLERLELGRTWSHHKLTDNKGEYLAYRKETPYQVSTAPSIWQTKALLRVLKEVAGSPWDFESGGKCRAGIVKHPAMNFIAESAISKRKPGKINLNGMLKGDIDQLIKEGLVNESEIVFNWK